MTGRIGYGVDDGGGRITAVRARLRRGRPVFEPVDAAALLQALRSGRVPVAAALSAGDAVLRRLEAPIASIRKARRIFPSLMEAGLPLPLEQCVTRFTDLRRHRAGAVAALGMAAPRERIEACRERFAGAGIALTRLDHEADVLWRRSLAEVPPAAPDEPRLVCYAAPSRLSLAMGRGAALQAAYGASGPLPPPGARRALQAWRAEAREPLRGCWAGPAAEDPAVRATLEAEWEKTGSVHFTAHANPGAFLARALAAAAVEAPGEGGFLSGELEPAALREAAERGIRRAAIFALASGLLLCAGAWRGRVRIERLETEAAEGLNALARETVGSAFVPPGFEEERVRTAVRGRADAAASLAVFFEPSLVAAVTTILEEAQAQDLWIERIQTDGSSLHVEGRAGEWRRPDRLAERLHTLGFSLRVTREDAGADERIPFAIRGDRP